MRALFVEVRMARFQLSTRVRGGGGGRLAGSGRSGLEEEEEGEDRAGGEGDTEVDLVLLAGPEPRRGEGVARWSWFELLF